MLSIEKKKLNEIFFFPLMEFPINFKTIMEAPGSDSDSGPSHSHKKSRYLNQEKIRNTERSEERRVGKECLE